MLPSGFQNVVGMSLALGAASYGVGLAPLSMSLSSTYASSILGYEAQADLRVARKTALYVV